MTKHVFKLRNVSFSYLKDRYGLKNIDTDVLAGESLAIIGANGSGKSTLLKLFNGLIFPQAGSFTAFEQKINEDILEKGEFAKFFRTKVAFVFQDSDIQLFSATVFEDLIFGPIQLGLSKEEAALRANDLLEMLEIKKLKDCSPNQLSGGEKKKVAIASSLSTNPDVLLLDEPTNNLDPKTKVWLYQFLTNLAETGKTIILATQDLELAKVFAKRTIVINEEHEIAADDNTSKILDNNELLLSVNLIHAHLHYHKKQAHAHTHTHHHANEHKHSH